MLYNEFINGTGCKDNEHNYKVYKDLEVMYMNSDMSKAEIYEYGKKLVDNSKSKRRLELEEKINAEIEECKVDIKWNRSQIQMYEDFIRLYPEDIWAENWKASVKGYKASNSKLRTRIRGLKWVLEV
jgi:NAD+--asparagine ADP-ribosyltransferase